MQELYERFHQFAFRKNPLDSPVAKIFLAHGYQIESHPLQPQYTDEDWLASRVSMSGLSIVFRQPTATDLLVCNIQRESPKRSMKSPLMGIARFFSFCRHYCPELEYVSGNITKASALERGDVELSEDRLLEFYQRQLGDVYCYKANGVTHIFAQLHKEDRYAQFPLWKRFKLKT